MSHHNPARLRGAFALAAATLSLFSTGCSMVLRVPDARVNAASSALDCPEERVEDSQGPHAFTLPYRHRYRGCGKEVSVDCQAMISSETYACAVSSPIAAAEPVVSPDDEEYAKRGGGKTSTAKNDAVGAKTQRK